MILLLAPLLVIALGGYRHLAHDMDRQAASGLLLIVVEWARRSGY